MAKVSAYDKNKTLNEIDSDLLKAMQSLINYRRTFTVPKDHDRDEIYMVTNIRVLAEEWLRWRLL